MPIKIGASCNQYGRQDSHRGIPDISLALLKVQASYAGRSFGQSLMWGSVPDSGARGQAEQPLSVAHVSQNMGDAPDSGACGR